MVQAKEVVVEVWGDFACFTAPSSKVERLTYPFPTPSAARGILSAIYSKPKEFYWQVNRIEVLNPIAYISFKRNEVKSTVSGKDFLSAEDDRTQRQTVALKDVHYRIAASIIPRPSFRGTENQLYEQALRRIRSGKCYVQPAFGLREFVAYFAAYEPSPSEKRPIPDTLDAGLMVYDVFDFIHDIEVKKKSTPALSLFHGIMDKGVIFIPPYESPDVLKGARTC
jgi:CRISPR-associated protein Cas5d